MTHFGILDYSIFVAYLVASLLVGLLFVKEQTTIRSYFLANRDMGFIVLGISILAALFSGISYLAIPGEVSVNGVAFFLVILSFFIATPIATIIFLPMFYRSRFYTAYQYLEERFSVIIRMMASSLFILRVLLWLALATYAPALALEAVTGMPLWFTIICTGVITTVYTTFGGMKAVIWTDVMQFGVLVVGQIVILVTAALAVPDGFWGAIDIGRQHGKFDVSLSLDPTVRVTLWGALIGGAFLNLVQMATDQVSVQRYLTASSLRESQRSLWLKLLLIIPVIGIFYLTGLVLFAFYHIKGDPMASGAITSMDQILPYFVINELPAGMPGLLIGAVYAASMSTISAGLNSMTTATIIDFYYRLSPSAAKATDVKQLRLAKALTLMYGVLVIVIAFQVDKLGTMLEASNKIIGLVGGPLLGLFLLGMLSRRANTPGAVAGWVAGIAILIPVCFYSQISFLWYTLIGLLVTLVIGWCVSWLFPPPTAKNLESLVWRKDLLEEPEEPLEAASATNPQETPIA
jgi:SSS family transporter